MFISLRKFTVIFLAILQLIAPLVHAHVGEKTGFSLSSGAGTLHVPGLERYSADRDAPMFQAEALHCNAATHDFSFDGMLIGIDACIKDRQTDAGINLGQSYYLHPEALLFNASLSSFDTNFSPQSQLLARQLLIPSLSPRAPPAQ